MTDEGVDTQIGGIAWEGYNIALALLCNKRSVPGERNVHHSNLSRNHINGRIG